MRIHAVRVAGNGLGSAVLGGLKYAIQHLGDSLKLIVILGHSGCGAVSAAVDAFLDPQAYLSFTATHALHEILDRLPIVVHGAAKRMQMSLGPEVVRRRGYRQALIETAIVFNAELVAHTVQQELGVADPHGLRAAYGAYLIATRKVWAPRSGSAEHAGLAYPPADVAAFADLADAVVRSERDASILGRGAE